MESKKRLAHATIVVVKNATGCLLSGKTSIDLNIVTITVNKVNTKPATFSKLSNHKKLPNRLRPVIAEFDEVFHGVGKLTDVQVHLHIDENVKPVVQPTRRIPFALRQKVEQEIVRLQENDIIEPAQGPTLWAWDTIYVDFLGPLPSKDLLLVVIDGRTRFPEVEIVRTTNAKSTINCFNRIFATHGLPRTIVSNNGPPFQSEELRQYMISNGITHRKITPLWPQANAEAETFMKPLTKCLQTAAIENKDWKQELQKFLFIYRATPHCTTKIPPATALFGRNIRTKLPQQEVSVNMRLVNKQINEADAETKLKSKNYADKRRGAKQLNFTVGDQVLVRQRKRNKLTSRFILSHTKLPTLKEQ